MQVPLGEFFRPRKKEVEQLDSKDFLGKPKVTGMCSLRLTASRLKSHLLTSPEGITVGRSTGGDPKAGLSGLAASQGIWDTEAEICKDCHLFYQNCTLVLKKPSQSWSLQSLKKLSRYSGNPVVVLLLTTTFSRGAHSSSTLLLTAAFLVGQAGNWGTNALARPLTQVSREFL